MDIIILAGADKATERKTKSGHSYRDAAIIAVSKINANRTVVVTKWTLGALGGGNVVATHGGSSLAESLGNGLKQCTTADWVMIVAADLPHINATAVEDFLQKVERASSTNSNSDVFVGYASMEDCRRLNHTSHRSIILDGAAVKLASVFLVRPQVLIDQSGVIGKLIAKRKSVLAIGLKLLGFKTALKLLRQGAFKLSELEAALAKKKVMAKGIRVQAELAVDDDT